MDEPSGPELVKMGKKEHGKHKDEHNFMQHLSKEVFNKEDDPEQLIRIKGLGPGILREDSHDKHPPRGRHPQNDQRLRELGQPKKGGEGGKYTWGGVPETIRMGLEELESGPPAIALDKNDPLAPDEGEERSVPFEKPARG